ncbi:MAG: hypothetical protein KAH44_08190 [Oricola sp.]|nr:hypothetical protein [Oricola sp.]
MVEGFLRLMENGPELIGSVNIGDPGEFTIRQLAEIIIEMAGSQSRFARFDLPRDDPTQRQPDITLAGEGLDWAPKVERAEGLGKTIAYFCVLLPELQTAS